MTVAIITGSCGLVGSECVHFFVSKGFKIVGIDNNMRAFFFGDSASTSWNRYLLQESYGDKYIHHNIDIRDRDAVETLFQEYSSDISLVIHTAAQPSHDWAARDPHTDFSVNANGTLVLLESTRKFCPEAVFIFTSTNKVYGDSPNYLPLEELDTRWEINHNHPYWNGIDESMSIDNSKHSLFGASKLAADILVQEYGKYFNMKTATFRGGCLTGSAHSATELHGFLAYLVKCTLTGQSYTIYGYKGKQVRDNIHSFDLVNAFYHFYQNPRSGEVYNIGGARHSNCSILEAITICEKITNQKLSFSYSDNNRSGDHIWYISDVQKFQTHYPAWKFTYNLEKIIEDICNGYSRRLLEKASK